MRVTMSGQNLRLRNDAQELRRLLNDATLQVSSQKKAPTFGGYEAKAGVLIALRNEVQAVAKYQDTIATTLTRTTAMQQGLNNVRAGGDKVANYALTALDGTPLAVSRIPFEARDALESALSGLNVQIGERYLLAGERRTTAPVAVADEIVNPTNGLGWMVATRLTADLGPLNQGWVDATANPVLGTLTIAKDAGFSTVGNFNEFGFTVQSVSYNGVAAATTNPIFSGPAENFTLAIPVVNDGDQFEMKVALPGSGKTITIGIGFTDDPVRAAAEGSILRDASLATNLTNLQNAIDAALRKHGANELTTDSARRAADMMFDYQIQNPPPAPQTPVPLYVGADPLFPGYPTLEYDNGATPVVARWYRGESYPPNLPQGLRSGSQAQVDRHQIIEYGVRADEEGVRDSIKLMSLLSVVSQTTMPDAYETLVTDAAIYLGGARDKVVDIKATLGLKEKSLETLETRHTALKATLSEQVLSIEEPDLYEVTSRIKQYETQLQAAYELTSRLQGLSLLNFLR